MHSTSRARVGNSTFSLTCSGAPPNSGRGGLVLGVAPWLPPVVVLDTSLLVDLGRPVIVLSAASDATGGSAVSLPIPADARLVGGNLFAQFLWIGPSTPSPCPPFGLSASHAIWITIQP